MEDPTAMFTVANPSSAQPTVRPPTSSAIHRIVSRVAARFAQAKTSAVVLRDVPVPGWDWGWVDNQIEPRLRIEPVDDEHRGLGCVYLEGVDGQPTFETVGHIPPAVLSELRRLVERHRHRIENAWVGTMLAKGWLDVELAERTDEIQITAYRGTPYQRLLVLKVNWPVVIGNRAPEPADISLDWERGLLLIGAREAKPVLALLAAYLW